MQDWMPGAEIVPTRHKGNTMLGGPAKCTHHITTGGGFDFLKGYLVAKGFEPTLLVHPVSGRYAQFIPASKGGYAMEHTTDPTNTQGSRHIQIEWCWDSMASLTITDAPQFWPVWRKVLAFLRANGVHDQFPFGAPVISSRRSLLWKTGGHAGHLNAPGNSHVDALPTTPAKVDLLFGSAPAPTPVPVPIPPVQEDKMYAVVADPGGAGGDYGTDGVTKFVFPSQKAKNDWALAFNAKRITLTIEAFDAIPTVKGA